MKALRPAFLAALLFVESAILIMAKTQGRQSKPKAADDLFKAGRFVEAERLYAKVLAENPQDYQATLRLGEIALFANRLEEASKWLSKAIELDPQAPAPGALLAQVFYRRDDFLRAAPLFRAIGLEAVARKLESFKGGAPYQIEGDAGVSRIKFIHTDPLPLLSVRINGGEEVNFMIDTGGSEVILDTDFAKEAGIVRFGSTTGTFGGGMQAPTEHGRVDSLTLGKFVVKNVPVHLLNTKPFAAAARGKRVDGILGSLLLYHFIATLDYPNGELVLRRKTKEALKRVEQRTKAEKQVVIPFWMAGGHYVVAWGRVNRGEPCLLFVDTGMAGGGFTAPESTIKAAGIDLSQGTEFGGVGGGGEVKAVLFEVNELALGNAKARGIVGFFGPFPPSLEYSEGFRIAGIISHQFFKPYAVTIDFIGMRFFLKKTK